ncbi:hypothetical protein RchiOBHm_Chr2g0130171 [Rosa chinensis]|uniref:Uncharacterized protein n=1 Tax=Rosa chinensis TaxID=74649 RepID=A0A2P6RUR9_ROSCH|nr:hypothetical protein RchiOBHm_Chr2g0130171 [Rosa chinensis]
MILFFPLLKATETKTPFFPLLSIYHAQVSHLFFFLCSRTTRPIFHPHFSFQKHQSRTHPLTLSISSSGQHNQEPHHKFLFLTKFHPLSLLIYSSPFLNQIPSFCQGSGFRYKGEYNSKLVMLTL